MRRLKILVIMTLLSTSLFSQKGEVTTDRGTEPKGTAIAGPDKIDVIISIPALNIGGEVNKTRPADYRDSNVKMGTPSGRQQPKMGTPSLPRIQPLKRALPKTKPRKFVSPKASGDFERY